MLTSPRLRCAYPLVAAFLLAGSLGSFVLGREFAAAHPALTPFIAALDVQGPSLTRGAPWQPLIVRGALGAALHFSQPVVTPPQRATTIRHRSLPTAAPLQSALMPVRAVAEMTKMTKEHGEGQGKAKGKRTEAHEKGARLQDRHGAQRSPPAGPSRHAEGQEHQQDG
jgi:hypothetical protein